jgi:hypothetical protein
VGKHLLEFGRPKLFWLSRPEYQLFKQSIFSSRAYRPKEETTEAKDFTKTEEGRGGREK